MKRLIIFLLILAGSVWLGVQIHTDPGYLLFFTACCVLSVARVQSVTVCNRGGVAGEFDDRKV
jgi:hypothetical protein